MQRIFFFLSVIVLSANLFAQTEAKRVAADVAPLVDDGVFGFVHLDLDKIDTKTGDTVLPTLELDAFLKPDMPIILTEKLGVRDVYVIFRPSGWPNVAVYGAVRPSKTASPEELGQLFGGMSYKYKKIGDHIFFGNIYEAETKILEQLKPSPRPDIETALASVEGSAAQAVFVPPSFAARIFEESSPALPVPFEETPITTLTRGARWIAAGWWAEKSEFRCIAQSENARAAADLKQFLDSAVDVAFQEFSGQIQFKKFFEDAPTAKEALRALIPKPDGDRLVLTAPRSVFTDKNNVPGRFGEIFLAYLREQADVRRCMNNLLQIMIALHNYHDVNKFFPAAYTVDKDGKPIHSWRVLILPWVEQNALYKKIRLDEPWDSEYNRQFHSQCPALFQCPVAVAKIPEIKKNGLTTYSIIVGKQTWPEPPKKFTIDSITDGTSNTIAVVERQTPVCWMDPTHEILEEDAVKGIGNTTAGIAAPHVVSNKFGCNVALFDGSVLFVTENVLPEPWKSLIYRNDGRSFGIMELYGAKR